MNLSVINLYQKSFVVKFLNELFSCSNDMESNVNRLCPILEWHNPQPLDLFLSHPCKSFSDCP